MLGGSAFLVLRTELRRRLGSFVALALIVAFGAGSSLGAFAAAQRTDTAYPQYVRDAEVSDLTINPSLATVAINRAIREFPGVVSAHSDALFLATVADTSPGPAAEVFGSSGALQVRGSTDGRYIDVDRPVIVSGRFASGQNEVFVSEDYHATLEKAVGRRLAVGDVIEMAFWWAALEDFPPSGDEVIAPIGVESLRIAGFGYLPDEILPDELYPRDRMIVSADVAARYGCLADIRPDMDADEAFAAFFPSNCSRQYQYYSLTLGGEASPATIQRAFTIAGDELNPLLPAFVQEQGAYYYYVALVRADLDEAVSQTTTPTVTTFVIFGWVSATATLVIVALVVARGLRRDDAARRTWFALGATRTQSARFAALPPLLAVTVGIAGAVAVGYLLSPIGPFGSVRVVQPSPGFSVDASVLVSVLLAVAATLAATIGALAFVTTLRASRIRSNSVTPGRAVRFMARGNKPAITVGIQASLDPTRLGSNLAVLGGALVAVTAGVAAITFGTNLSNLVNEPEAYGWPWDAAVITGGGYGDTDTEHVDKVLGAHPDVADYAFFAFDSTSRVDDRPVTAIYGAAGDEVPFPILAGRAPVRPGEAILGSTTADELNISIGDRVSLETYVFDIDEIEIVGTSVLPSLGSVIADRIGLGRGAYIAVDAPELSLDGATMTAIRLRSGTNPETFLAELPDLRDWDLLHAQPFTYSAPVRPPEIIDVSSMRAAPLVVGGLLATALTVGLGLSMAVSVRDRRRELAILRALGFSSQQLRSTIRWQALSAIAVGIVAGTPLGIVFGRWSWQSFANQLGVVPRAEVPVGLLALVLVIAVVVTQVAAAMPAWAAARVNPAELLRDS